MPTPLRVLIAEDRPTDAELMIYELGRSGFEVKWKRVETEAEYLTELATAPDVILADHTLPQFNAPRALDLLKATGLDIPLIVVTGSISEEIAVERIKQGAADYILKDRMTRLGEAVKRALEERKLRDENRKAAADLQTRYQELQTLHEINQTILGSLDLKGILEKILDQAMALDSFDLGTILLVDPRGERVEAVTARGYRVSANLQRQPRDEVPGKSRYRAFRYEKTYVVENVAETDGLRTLKREGVQSAILTPVRAADKTLGFIQVGSRTPRKFHPDKIRLLETIGNQMGIAIQKARLYEEAQRNLERVKALHEIDLAITSTLDLRTILKVLLEKIERFFPHLSAATVRLLNRETGSLDSLACRGLNEEEWRKQQTKELIGRAKQVVQTKAPLIVRNVGTDPRTFNSQMYLKYGLLSYAGIPLIVKNEVIGVLGIYTKEEHDFTDEEIESLSTLAGQAAIAIHNARLHEETERRRHEAEELARVARSLTETLDVTAVGERIVTSVHELFGPKHATLRLLQPDGSLRAIASSGEVFSRSPRGDAVPSGTGVTSRAIAEGKPIWSADMLNDPEIHLTDRMRDYQLRSGNRAMLAVPLRAHEKIIGALALSDQAGRIYSDNEVALIQTFADQAALALENARLYQDIDSSRRELELTNQYLERSLKQLSSLYTALAPLTSSESANEMLDGIIDRLMEATGADAVQIRLLNKDSGRLVSASQRGFPDHYLRTVDVAPPGGAADWVFKTEEPIIAPDIAQDARIKGKVRLEVGLRSCAMLPLKVHNEIRGIVHLASREVGYFDQEQKDHLMAIARQMGIALENRELFDELKASNVELERSNKVKDEFLSVMSHELRTPLNVVVGYAGMIKDKMLGEINPKQAEACTKIVRRTNDLLWMVNSILYTTSLEANEAKVKAHEVNLKDLLEELKSAYDVTLTNQLVLTWDCPPNLPIIRTDGAKLKHILENLISNAVKFTEKGNVTVSVRVKEGPCQEAIENSTHASSLPPNTSPKWFAFQVTDTGIGISKEHLPSIFEKFKQLDSSETRLYAGVGLGLYVVKRFTELLGGQIVVESEPGKGSTFTVRIPLAEVDREGAGEQRS